MRVGSLGSGGGGWTASLEGCPGMGGGLACEEREGYSVCVCVCAIVKSEWHIMLKMNSIIFDKV